MKKTLLILILLMLPIVYGIGECKEILEPTDIPCRATTNWNYSSPCNGHTASTYNQSGGLIQTDIFEDYGTTGLCFFTWNISTAGTYTFITDTGDTGNIIVEITMLSLTLIIGIGIVAALLLWIAFKLDAQHGLLKLLLTISALTLCILIPVSTFIPGEIGKTFYSIFLWIFVAIWLYIIVYFFWWVVNKMIDMVRQT